MATGSFLIRTAKRSAGSFIRTALNSNATFRPQKTTIPAFFLFLSYEKVFSFFPLLLLFCFPHFRAGRFGAYALLFLCARLPEHAPCDQPGNKRDQRAQRKIPRPPALSLRILFY